MDTWAVVLLFFVILIVSLIAFYFIIKIYFPTLYGQIFGQDEEGESLTKRLNQTYSSEWTGHDSKQSRGHDASVKTSEDVSGERASSPGSTGSEYEPAHNLPRVASTDSLASDTSVMELQPDLSRIGQIEVGLEFERETSELIISVIQARDLSSEDSHADLDYYVNIALLPDPANVKSKTKTQRKTTSPVFKERFFYALESHEIQTRSAVFQVFSVDKYARHKLVGEAQVKMSDLELARPLRLWLNLREIDEKPSEYGELMFSLSYLPTAERLTVVVVKAKNLKWMNAKQIAGDVLIKVHLLQNGKRIAKKKTTVKRRENQPTYNECMIFLLPQSALNQVQLRLTVAEVLGDGRLYSIGHVIVGGNTGGTELTHWQQMMSSLRKPIAMWHYLRKQEKTARNKQGVAEPDTSQITDPDIDPGDPFDMPETAT